MMLPRHLAAALFILIAANANAQTLPTDAKLKTGKLPNGFTYYIQHNTEPKNRATLYLVVKAGSILENENQRGLAHFMEHMSFNGTKNFPKNQLVDYLQKSGIRFGADLNAYTGFDETVYQLPIPTDNKDILDNGLKIMREWAQNATLDTEEIEKERGVVLEEKRLRLGSSQRIQDQTLPVLLNHSRYADRLPIGTENVLKNFTPPTIKAFYRDWYRPDLEAIIIVGDIDVQQMEKEVKRLFSDLKTPATKKPRIPYTIALNGKNTYKTVTDPEVSQTSVEFVYKHKERITKTENDYVQAIQRALFSNMLNARLTERSKTPNAPFTGLSGGYQPLMGGLDALTIECTPVKGKLKEATDVTLTEMERVKKYGFTEPELVRAKQSFISSLEVALKEKDKQTSTFLADQYKNLFLKGEAVPGIEKEYALAKKIVPSITGQHIHLLAQSLFKNTDRSIFITAPATEKDNLPAEATFNAWIADIAKQDIAPYTDAAENNALLAALPVSGKVISENKIAELGITEWQLSNGAKVIIKPTNFKNDELHFLAVSEGGTSLYADSDVESVANAAGIIASSGLGAHDNITLPKLLSGKQVSVQPFINERFEGLQGGSTIADIETAMQLIYLYYTAPRMDSNVFNMIIRNSAENIRNRYANPAAVFADTVSAVLGNYSVRRSGPSMEKLNAIDLDKVMKTYGERFANAGDFCFFFVGSFNTDSLKNFVEQYIASLPSGDKQETARDIRIHIPEGNISKTVYAGKEDKATVQLVFSGNYEYSPANNIALSALQELLNYRLIKRLREKEGGVYTPSVRINRTKYPRNRYSVVINFGCAPANVESLINATLEEMRSMKTVIDEEDLRKFRAETKRQNELAMQDNGFWLNYLSGQYIDHEDAKHILSVDSLVDKLEAPAIREAAKRYFNEDNFIRFVLLPEGK